MKVLPVSEPIDRRIELTKTPFSGSILQLNVGLALCLQGLVMYSYHRPYEEELEVPHSLISHPQITYIFYSQPQTTSSIFSPLFIKPHKTNLTLVFTPVTPPTTIPPQNNLAICMQLETFLTVYVALLGVFYGGSFAPKDEQALRIILTVTTTFCLVFGFSIITVAMCKSPYLSLF